MKILHNLFKLDMKKKVCDSEKFAVCYRLFNKVAYHRSLRSRTNGWRQVGLS